jgi:hypothetical protein
MVRRRRLSKEPTPKRGAASGNTRSWLDLWAVGRYDLRCSDVEFWSLTLEEYNALVERDLEFHDNLEYYASLSPWAVFNVNRSKGVAFMDPTDFMMRRRSRLRLVGVPSPESPPQGRPAILLAPVPTTGVRPALKGERPASRFAPGQNDGVIERFDAYVMARSSGKVQHGR